MRINFRNFAKHRYIARNKTMSENEIRTANFLFIVQNPRNNKIQVHTVCIFVELPSNTELTNLSSSFGGSEIYLSIPRISRLLTRKPPPPPSPGLHSWL